MIKKSQQIFIFWERGSTSFYYCYFDTGMMHGGCCLCWHGAPDMHGPRESNS